ncbi:MAG TPA: tol-pal system protein YbgF [Candidatus Binatia bacterium]|nr:tol-pal system protein YbgF [Candidatus Binatia bacterium]
MGNFFVVTFVALLSLVWASGCATQTDIQAEQQARESLRAQMADTKASLEDTRREIARVRGEVEEVRYRLDRLAKERVGSGPQLKILEDRIEVLERQLRPHEELVTPPPSVTPEPPLPKPVEPPSSGGTSGGVREDTHLSKEPSEVQDEYKLALRALNDQQYDKAIQQFRNFQRKYPNSDMADDAQYWIGESYFNQKDYNRAILEFNDVLKYRRGDKVPAALLRQAQAFLEIGDRTDARLILQKLVNDHPNSEQAREARDRLQALGR